MTIEFCEKHKTEKKLAEFRFPGISPYYCVECVEESVAEQKEQDRLDRIRQDEERRLYLERTKYDHLQIGKRFMSSTFDNYVAKTAEQQKAVTICRRYAESFHDRHKAGDSLILSGNPGTGKNHLAAAIAKAVIDKKYVVLHTTTTKLMRDIKETWRKGSERSEREAIDSFIAPDLLIVDEVGMQFGSASEQIIFMEVINSRYADCRPTIMISMYEVADLETIIGRQVVDRFREGKSCIVKFDWASHRAIAGKDQAE